MTWTSRVGSISFTASGTQRPTAGATLGGRPSLRFTTGQFLTSSTLLSAIFAAANWSIYLVLRPKNYGTTSTTISGATTGANLIFCDDAENFVVGHRSDFGGQIFGTNKDGGAVYRHYWRRVAVDRPILFAFRGSTATNGLVSVDQGVVANHEASATIGSLTSALRVGGRASGLSGDFEVTRIFAYNRVTTPAEHATITAAVCAEYGITSPAFDLETVASPTYWLDVEPGRVFQDTAGTIPATSNSNPIARINNRAGNNAVQATVGNQPYFWEARSGLWVARSDTIDDHIGDNATTIAAGRKTVAMSAWKFGHPGATSIASYVRMGQNSNQIILAEGGLSASSGAGAGRGWSFGFDRNTTSAQSIQDTAAPTTQVPLGLVTFAGRYLGGGAATVAQYSAYLNGTLLSLVGGLNIGGSGFNRVLARSDALQPVNAGIRRLVVYALAFAPEDLEALSVLLESER